MRTEPSAPAGLAAGNANANAAATSDPRSLRLDTVGEPTGGATQTRRRKPASPARPACTSSITCVLMCRSSAAARPTRSLKTRRGASARARARTAQWRATADQVRGSLGDHDRRRVRVAAGDQRHDRRVDHAQARRRRARAARRRRRPCRRSPIRHVPDRVVEQLDAAPHVGAQVVVVLHAVAREQLAPTHRAQRLGGDDLARELDPGDERGQVLGLGQRVRDDPRLVASGRPSAAAATPRLRGAIEHRRQRQRVPVERPGAVVDEVRGREVELQVGRGQPGPAAHERERLGDRRGQRPAAAQQPLGQVARVLGVGQRARP